MNAVYYHLIAIQQNLISSIAQMKINSFGKIKINVNSFQHKTKHGDGDQLCASVVEIMKTKKLNVD